MYTTQYPYIFLFQFYNILDVVFLFVWYRLRFMQRVYWTWMILLCLYMHCFVVVKSHIYHLVYWSQRIQKTRNTIYDMTWCVRLISSRYIYFCITLILMIIFFGNNYVCIARCAHRLIFFLSFRYDVLVLVEQSAYLKSCTLM